MDRVFLDANLLFIASYRESSRLAPLWQLTSVRLLTSAFALREAWRNIDLPAQRLRLAALVDSLEQVVEDPQHAALASSFALPAKDVPVLHAAISGRATHLLTADEQHFGPLFGQTIGGVLILPPADYLLGKTPV